MPTSVAPVSGPAPTNVADVPGLRELWAQTLGDPRICVAVLDGPVDSTHPAFRGAAISQVQDDGVTESRCVLSDHGTHVASIIFGQHHSPVKGVAPRCRGVIIPIFDYAADGSLKPSTQERLARAIRLALRHGANVINISAGQFSFDGQASKELEAAVRECEGRALIVAAAGNDGCDCLHLPGALPSVLTVGAMNSQGEPLPFSNWGEAYRHHGVLAPGQQIIGASLEGGTAHHTGTSFATPIVSGVAALALSSLIEQRRMPSTADVTAAILQSTIDCDIQPTSDCSKLLSGRLNITGAIEALNRGSNEMHETGYIDANNIDSQTGGPQAISPQATDEVTASCECGCSPGMAELIYTIGRLSYEFPSLARERSILQHMDELPGRRPDPKDPCDFLRYLLGFREIEIKQTDLGIGRIVDIATEKKRPKVTVDRDTFSAADEQRRIQLTGIETLLEQPSSLNGRQEIREVIDARTILLELRHPGDTYAPHTGEFLLPRGCEPAVRHSGHMYDAASAIWTIERDHHPFYAVKPSGSFSEEAYRELVEFLLQQAGFTRRALDFYFYRIGDERIPWMYGWDPCFNGEAYKDPDKAVPSFSVAHQDDEMSQVAFPGELGGTVTLLDGNVLPVIAPDMRGSEAWSYRSFFGEVDEWVDTLFHRFAEEIRNDGRTPEERALNFASIQLLIHLRDNYERIEQEGLELDQVLPPKATRTCPPTSQCYTVELTLFDPVNVERANIVVSVTVDVSDVVPVLLDGPREFRRRS